MSSSRARAREGIGVFELLGRPDEGAAESGDFAAAVALFEAGELTAAAAAFQHIAELEPPSRIYLEQIAELQRATSLPQNFMIILHEK
jgi:hypothetical protein